MMNNEEVASFVEKALTGEEPRRGVWTDRDYLVAVLAMTGGGERARKAMLAKPKALLDENKPMKHKGEPWWYQYYKVADELDKWDSRDPSLALALAADDIRTLVDGLRDLERKLGEVSSPDPSLESL